MLMEEAKKEEEEEELHLQLDDEDDPFSFLDSCTPTSHSFLDLLSFHDHPFSQPSLPPPPPQPNPPFVPPSPSLSSSSTDADPSRSAASEPTHEDNEDGSTTKKQSGKGGRKKGQKRKREQRFAFVTKSEVDHLEDGYRWRKYGQKGVKNSPHPRSYYRCTNTMCGVKKRVERSSEDPSLVVTTYEGQHTHPSPVVSRGGPATSSSAPPRPAAAPFSLPLPQPAHRLPHPPLPPLQFNFPPPPSLAFGGTPANNRPPSTLPTGARDDGLLQDLVPSDLRNKK